MDGVELRWMECGNVCYTAAVFPTVWKGVVQPKDGCSTTQKLEEDGLLSS